MDENELGMSTLDETVTSSNSCRDLFLHGYEPELDFLKFEFLGRVRVHTKVIQRQHTRPFPRGIVYLCSCS